MSRRRSAALVGNPNAGKSALFNALTGARQKIANYPGVTVERKAGRLLLPSGEPVELTDLPGSYGLHPTSPDEEVTRKVILGLFPGEPAPEVLVVVLDASNLEQHLVFAQEVIALGRPTVVALNMIDLAERDGLTLDPRALETALGIRVVPTVAVRRRGLAELAEAIAAAEERAPQPQHATITQTERRVSVHAIADAAIVAETAKHRLHSKLDRVLLDPWAGPLILFALLFVVFQAVFAWAANEASRPATTAEIYRTYHESRLRTLAILEGLSPWDWLRSGYHTEFGPVTILQQASYFATHEQTHLASLSALHDM